MSDAIIVALITGGVTLLGTIITVLASSRKQAIEMEKNQAVTDVKIEELTREVRLHNEFAARVPLVEKEIEVINHRLKNLEEKAG